MPTEGGWGDPQPTILADGTHVRLYRRKPEAPVPATEPYEPARPRSVLTVALLMTATVLSLMLAVALAVGGLP